MVRNCLFALLANVVFSFAAHAAVITATTSATYSFDTSALSSPFSINGGAWNCYVTCTNGVNGPELFDASASARFDFGTSAGSADLGSLLVTNPVDFAIADLSGAIFGTNQIDILSDLDTLFVTLVFVDDLFAVDWFSLTAGASNFLLGTLVQPVNEVPLPSALSLFLLGIAGLISARSSTKTLYDHGFQL